MAEEFRTIPDVLSHVGSQLTNHGDSLLAMQQCCQGQAEGARAGWVGSSASALSGLLDGWTKASTAHVGRFGEHARGMQVAAVGFSEMEARNVAALAADRPAR